MFLFEPYRPLLTATDRPEPLAKLITRPVEFSDAEELARIQSEYDGGDPDLICQEIERAISSWSKDRRALDLVAVDGGRVVAFGKVRYLTPPGDPPANIVPPGWYLAGVTVATAFRRRGIAKSLTQQRLDWIATRARYAFYTASIRNCASIALHQRFGFVEVTRNFTQPGVTFEGGGVLFRADLDQMDD